MRIDFPIALFLASMMLDCVVHWTKNRVPAGVAYHNLLVAAISCVPVRLALAIGRPAAKRDSATARYPRARLLHLDLAGLLAAYQSR